MKTYNDLMRIDSYHERLAYLKIDDIVGEEKSNDSRIIKQNFYRSAAWRQFRKSIVARDLGFDVGHRDYEIMGPITIHHINPITSEDILNGEGCVVDPNNVISVSDDTHKYIHYGVVPREEYSPRKPGDTKLW